MVTQKGETQKLRKTAFDIDGATAAAFAVIGRTALHGALTGAKSALAGTLDQTLTMILHGYLLFYLFVFDRRHLGTPVVFYISCRKIILIFTSIARVFLIVFYGNDNPSIASVFLPTQKGNPP